MPRVPKCDVCGKPARRGKQVGNMYACPSCLELAEQDAKEIMHPPEYIGDVSAQVGRDLNPEQTEFEKAFAEVPSVPMERLDRFPPPGFQPKSGLAARLYPQVDNAPHVIVEARAGTGKTTTLVEGLKELRNLPTSVDPSPQQLEVWKAICQSRHRASSVCFVAFNKSIATELQKRVPLGCSAMTMHSMGFKAVQATFGRVQVNNYRVQDIISKITGKDIRELRRWKMEVLKATESLVGLCKMNLVGNSQTVDARIGTMTTREELWDLASYYDIDLNGNSTEVFSLVPQVLERCKDVAKDHCVDFDDMVWLPVALNLSMTKYDVLLVDEAQDLNRCQQQLALKAGTRLILCGDPRQAIYGFAGADAQSMSRMQKILEATDRGCVHLPLTVTRRCGKAIVEEARKIVPDFDYWKTNPEGKISQAAYAKGKDSYLEQVLDGDMILCRVNAPLVSQCFRFLKAGRKATIQGRDVGQGLISTIKKCKATDLPDLASKLSDWLHTETMKETAKRNPNENKLIALQDRVDCLYCFMEGQSTVDGVIEKINSVFTDNKDSPGIRLSSVHRAKGLEAQRIFFLMPEGAGCPHPMAKTAWAREQENNLLYVGITRAISELVYVR